MRNVTKLAAALMLIGVVSQAAEKPAAGKPDMKAMQELMMKLAQPGPEHEGFQKMVGNWDCTCRSYCDPETGETLTTPMESKGKAKFTLLLGGRFLQQEFQGEFQGMKFEGLGLCGYDNGNQKYVGTWVDNMGTGIMHNEGTMDEKTQTLNETGTYEMPGMTMKFKLATKHVNDNEVLFTMSMVEGDAKEVKKVMEITYKRKS